MRILKKKYVASSVYNSCDDKEPVRKRRKMSCTDYRSVHERELELMEAPMHQNDRRVDIEDRSVATQEKSLEGLVNAVAAQVRAKTIE